MQPLMITTHSLAGWSPYAEQFGFVPDPMILRTGEVFLNGASGSGALERSDFDVWRALLENLGGLLDFFDMVVTRDTIPLINYGDTFDRMRVVAPLDQILPNRTRNVEVDYTVYNTIKKGALLRLAELDPVALRNFGCLVDGELNALRYDWKPSLDAPYSDEATVATRKKLEGIDATARTAAQFLLGGFIFSGFAQASATTHYIQPKRARFFLGLTAAPGEAGMFSGGDEENIFRGVEERLRGTNVLAQKIAPLPPVLPYLLAQGEPGSARALLDRALAFRESPQGAIYRKATNQIRSDGTEARRVEDVARLERESAIALLAPYSKLDTERSRSLDVKLSAETTAVPLTKLTAETTLKLKIPTWLRIWWNDEIPFGGIHKTLRRMWMASESYEDLASKLQRVWAKS